MPIHFGPGDVPNYGGRGAALMGRRKRAYMNSQKAHRDPLNEAIARSIQNAQAKSRNTSPSVRGGYSPQRKRRASGTANPGAGMGFANGAIPHLPPPAVIEYQPLGGMTAHPFAAAPAGVDALTMLRRRMMGLV